MHNQRYRRRKARPLWVKGDHTACKRGERFSGTLPTNIPRGNDTPASKFKITSAFDGEITYHAGGYGDRPIFKADERPPHHIRNLELREAYEKDIRVKERKARRIIRALEAGIWAWTRETGVPTLEGGSCQRVPYWRDWKPTNMHITPVKDGDGIKHAPVRLRVPNTSTAYGTGLDVESYMQMNAKFAERMNR